MLPRDPYAPNWPDEALWQRLLLENPWPLAIAMFAAAILLILLGGRSGNVRQQKLSIAPLAIGVSIIVAAHFVETTGEQVRRRTHAMVEAAIQMASINPPADASALANLLADDAVMHILGEPTNIGKPAMLTMVNAAVRLYRVTGFNVQDLQSHVETADTAYSYLHVLTHGDTTFGSRPLLSSWVFTWRKEQDGVWRAVVVNWQTYNGNAARRDALP